MLSDEQLTELYNKEFSSAKSFEEISDKLLAMESEYVDDLRSTFLNELLYEISIGLTKYDKEDELSRRSKKLFCENVDLLPKTNYYFRAMGSFFQHEHNQCLSLISKSLEAELKEMPDTSIDEFYFVDRFFEPYKEAFEGFWPALKDIILKHPHQPFVPSLCETIDAYYKCKTDEEALGLLLSAHSENPESVLLKELIAHTYYSLKMWNNSVAYFEQVEDNNIFFRNDALYFMMAWCYGKTKDRKLEEEYYRKSLEIVPTNVLTLNNLAYALYSQKRYTESKALLEECLTYAPHYNYANNNYVRVLIALGLYKDAKSYVNTGHKIAASLKRKVEKLENVNHAKTPPAKVTIHEDSFDDNAMQQPEVVLNIKRQQFSSEKILEDELVSRIESGTDVFGLKLKIFRRKGLYGRQFIIPVGRLDLLCEDEEGNFYIIELKKDSGYDDPYQQTANYLDWFEKSEYAEGKKIYGIICLNSPTNALIKKVHNDKRMKLFEYSISYTEIRG